MNFASSFKANLQSSIARPKFSEKVQKTREIYYFLNLSTLFHCLLRCMCMSARLLQSWALTFFSELLASIPSVQDYIACRMKYFFPAPFLKCSLPFSYQSKNTINPIFLIHLELITLWLLARFSGVSSWSRFYSARKSGQSSMFVGISFIKRGWFFKQFVVSSHS